MLARRSQSAYLTSALALNKALFQVDRSQSDLIELLSLYFLSDLDIV